MCGSTNVDDFDDIFILGGGCFSTQGPTPCDLS